MKFRRLAVAVALALLSAVGVAQVVSLFSVGIQNAFLVVSTAQLPRGWFTKGGAFARSKTDLQTSYSFDGTTCSPAASGDTVHSLTTGNMNPITNSSNGPVPNVVGYTWDTSVDLSSFQNHWYEHVHCDGTIEVHGCADARPVRVTSTIVDPQNGSCRPYEGTTTCVLETALLSLPSVKDPTVVDTQCGDEGDSCGIGQCVSACEHSCDAQFPAQNQLAQRKACQEGCVCTCKLSRPAGCPQPQNCD
jgi:hypothetical protein